MKIIFNTEGKAQGTALDSYEGPDAWGYVEDDGFVPELLDQYTLVNGAVVFTPTSRITRLAFRNRFTQTEKVALELASQHNPAGTAPQQQGAAMLRAYLADVNAATFVDLARADTRAGVQYLETMGLLGTGRALEILDDPILPEERPLA